MTFSFAESIGPITLIPRTKGAFSVEKEKEKKLTLFFPSKFYQISIKIVGLRWEMQILKEKKRLACFIDLNKNLNFSKKKYYKKQKETKGLLSN